MSGLTKHRLSIDLETYSDVSLPDVGAFRYINSPAFEILLFGYSVDYAPAVTIDIACGEPVPDWLIDALKCDDYIKSAYNAAFEWGCLSKVFGQLPPSQWRDTMLHGLYCGYPGSLEATGRAVGLPEDKQKLNTGKALIRYFCNPCKPTKVNGGRTRNLPQHDPAKWKLFKEYNTQDVEAEMEIDKYLSAFPVPAEVQKQWETDLIINARGVYVDMGFTHGALYVGKAVKDELTTEAVGISGLRNPNSVNQLRDWLNAETDEKTSIDNLRKETVSTLIAQGGHHENVQRMLEIRQELGKTSTKKYDAIEACVCSDGRVRGLLQFYGANRTGRWAGRLVQVQNLPRTYTEPLETAREFVKSRKKNHLRLIYGNVSDTLSQLIRTAFIATPGNVLIDADFSAIEARVISWLAGEQWRLDVFRTTGKIYEASAAMIYHVPVETIVKGNPNYALRQRGKVAELALGYQGGVGAMRRMDSSHALDDMSNDEVQEIVNNWRNANSCIRELWYDMNNAAIQVVTYGGSVRVRDLVVSREYDTLHGTCYMTIKLPSGRKLYYVNPAISENRWGAPSITYMGVDQTTKRWQKVETYGGKLTENCIQAIARDCLAVAIEHLEAAGFPIVFHVHDEVVIDIKPFADNQTMLAKVKQIMTAPIPWAQGLPLAADGWVGTFFKKD
jgi:DNA polymerase